MRPEILNPLFSRISALSGVGIKIGSRFDKLLVDEKSKKQARSTTLFLMNIPLGMQVLAIGKELKGLTTIRLA